LIDFCRANSDVFAYIQANPKIVKHADFIHNDEKPLNDDLLLNLTGNGTLISHRATWPVEPPSSFLTLLSASSLAHNHR
jgi:hypothetical protein